MALTAALRHDKPKGSTTVDVVDSSWNTSEWVLCCMGVAVLMVFMLLLSLMRRRPEKVVTVVEEESVAPVVSMAPVVEPPTMPEVEETVDEFPIVEKQTVVCAHCHR